LKPEIIIAIITLAGVVVTGGSTIIVAILRFKDRKILVEVNEAVNNRVAKRGPEAKLLYDLVWENHKKSQKLEGHIDATQKKVEGVSDQIKELPCKDQQFYCPLQGK
jgi:hypothetical protein